MQKNAKGVLRRPSVGNNVEERLNLGRGRGTERDEMVFFSDSSSDKEGSLSGNFVSETVQGDTKSKGVLRRPTLVNRGAEMLSLGRGRGTNMTMENKLVSAQNGTRGILVSDSGVKESEIINIKPRIKRVTSSTNQGAVNKCIGGKESEIVESMGIAEQIQNRVMREPPVATSELVQNVATHNPSLGKASLINLENRISTLEMEVSNDLSLILLVTQSLKTKFFRLRFSPG